MALDKKVYGVRTPFLARNLAVYGIFAVRSKNENPLRPNQKLATSLDFNCKDNLSAIRAMNSELVGVLTFSFGFHILVLGVIPLTAVPAVEVGSTKPVLLNQQR